MTPLTDVLKNSPTGTARLNLSAAMTAAFTSAKEVLASATELAHPSSGSELTLVADVISSYVGAALHQRRTSGGPWELLGFFSRKLDKAQSSYSAFDRELLEAHSAIRFFRFQLKGRPFQLWTDHKPLTFALGRISDAWTPAWLHHRVHKRHLVCTRN